MQPKTTQNDPKQKAPWRIREPLKGTEAGFLTKNYSFTPCLLQETRLLNWF